MNGRGDYLVFIDSYGHYVITTCIFIKLVLQNLIDERRKKQLFIYGLVYLVSIDFM